MDYRRQGWERQTGGWLISSAARGVIEVSGGRSTRAPLGGTLVCIGGLLNPGISARLEVWQRAWAQQQPARAVEQALLTSRCRRQ